MSDSIHAKRQRARLVAAATLVSGVLVAGCGGSSSNPTAATVDGAITSASNLASAGSTASSSAPRGRSRSPSACAPTACPTSQTPTRAGVSSSMRARGSSHRPRSKQHMRSAGSSCPPAVRSARGHLRRQRRWRSYGGSPCACASTASRVPRPHDLGPTRVYPKPRRVPRDHQLPGSDPLVPGHDRPAVTSVRAGRDRLWRRFPRREQRPLMEPES